MSETPKVIEKRFSTDDGHDHVVDDWRTKTGLPKPTQYRTCVLPGCTYVENRPAPNA